jgi:MOSC domain-containing protein YiiM
MLIETIAVGQPQKILLDDKETFTAIFKRSITGPVMVRFKNIDGDRQALVDGHGGKYKAVYAYSGVHYPWWTRDLGRELERAQFGENLTISDWDDAATCIGDVLRVGEAELIASEPRLPCSKLALRTGVPHMVKRFNDARRWGIYFEVGKEGLISVGNRVEVIFSHPERVPVYELARVYLFDRDDRAAMARLAGLEHLDPQWREAFAKRLRGQTAAAE